MNMQGNNQQNEADGAESAEPGDWVNRLSNCTGHHHESMVAVAEGLVIEIPDVASRLREAIASGKASDVERRAHTLKSCLKYVTDGPEVRLAQQIEQSGKDEKIEIAQALYEQLTPDLHDWVTRIQTWLDEQ